MVSALTLCLLSTSCGNCLVADVVAVVLQFLCFLVALVFARDWMESLKRWI